MKFDELVESILIEKSVVDFIKRQSVVDVIKRQLGLSWGKIGDKVSGSTVAEYVMNQGYGFLSLAKSMKDMVFQLQMVPLEIVRQWNTKSVEHANKDQEKLGITPNPKYSSHLDPWKVQRIKKKPFTTQSLKKTPPVVLKDGSIVDGHHRIHIALRHKTTFPENQMPVLVQIK